VMRLFKTFVAENGFKDYEQALLYLLQRVGYGVERTYKMRVADEAEGFRFSEFKSKPTRAEPTLITSEEARFGSSEG